MQDPYSVFFNIDEDYLPAVTDQAMDEHDASGSDFWMRTYPHKSFMQMAREMVKILERQNHRSLWIEGVYGSGKSMCAYTLSHLLSEPEELVKEYWNRFSPFKKESSLLKNLLAHRKSHQIVVARRYGSSELIDESCLFAAIQESIDKAIRKANIKYLGSKTFKNNAIEWLSEEDNNLHFNRLIKKNPQIFGMVKDANHIINLLQTTEDIFELDEILSAIFSVARKAGITALSISLDRLCDWITDVVTTNKIEFVLFWDEFSEFFEKNKTLTSFQKIVELCTRIPFYLIVVTHDKVESFSSSAFRKVRDRFEICPIELPEKVAFELIGEAFTVKEDAKKTWRSRSEDLFARVKRSTRAIMDATDIDDEEIVRNILPFHPMAAFVLKNIATAYQSNQRSMFDFVNAVYPKDADPEDPAYAHAFRWFTHNNSPRGSKPFLTVDLLWDYFYDHDNQQLSATIRNILNGFARRAPTLSSVEQDVLKTILILQALHAETKGLVELLAPTNVNLRLAFEGTENLSENSSVTVAENLVKRAILQKVPYGGVKDNFIYTVESGEQFKPLDEEEATTRILVSSNVDPAFDTILNLNQALRFRFETGQLGASAGKVAILTQKDYAQTIQKYRGKEPEWKITTFVAVARNEEEARWLSDKIRDDADAASNRNIVFIDATTERLTEEEYENYRRSCGGIRHYQGKDPASAQKYLAESNAVINTWREKIQKGPLLVYYDGQTWQANGIQRLKEILENIVKDKYPQAFELTTGLTENMLKMTQGPSSARAGMLEKTSGVVVNIEKKLFPEPGIWGTPQYWETSPYATVSVVKLALEKFIRDSLRKSGHVSVVEIWTLLETQFGFGRSNLHAFLAGFLLKEYAQNTSLRYGDVNGAQEEMKPELLSETLGNYIGGKSTKDAYIISQTEDEKKLYKVATTVWNATKPTSPAMVGDAVIRFFKQRGLPVDVLESVTDAATYKFARGFVALAKESSSAGQQSAGRALGAEARKNPELVDSLKDALSEEKFNEGAEAWLRKYDNGELYAVAETIKARLIHDVRNRFNVEYHTLWSEETQLAELAKLKVEYRFAHLTNQLFNGQTKSRTEAEALWREKLQFFRISHETLEEQIPILGDVLVHIVRHSEVISSRLEEATAEFEQNFEYLDGLFREETTVFRAEYASWLKNLSDAEIDVCIGNMQSEMFVKSRSACNELVKKGAEGLLLSGKRREFQDLWRSGTKTKDGHEWSRKNDVPILSLVDDDEYDAAKRVFSALHSNNPSDAEVEFGIEFLKTTSLFGKLKDQEAIQQALITKVLRDKSVVQLVGVEKAVEELKALPIETYDWDSHPSVRTRLEQLTFEEYDAGGEEKVVGKIDSMKPENLKRYLKKLIHGNKRVGIEILLDDEK